MLELLLLFILFSSPAQAMDADGKGDISLAAGYREFPQRGLGPYRNAWETIFISSYQARLYPFAALRVEATPELRGFVSRVVERGSGDPGYATVKGPTRLFDLEQEIASGNTAEWYLDAQRLNFVISAGAFEAQIGRKPIGVGTLKVLPIWNKFSRPLPNTAGPNLIYGQDSATVRWQSGELAFLALDIEGERFLKDQAVRWFESIWYHPSLELHLMGSRWWDRTVLGLAFAKDLGGATLRGEGLAIGLDRKEKEYQAGLGAEYAVNEMWTLLAETLYQSDGAGSTSEYTVLIASRYRPLRAKGYVYLQAAAQLDAYWVMSLAALANAVDGSFYPLFKITRSLSDHLDASLDLRGPVGANGKEFSPETFHFPFNRMIGAPSQAQVQLTASF